MPKLTIFSKIENLEDATQMINSALFLFRLFLLFGVVQLVLSDVRVHSSVLDRLFNNAKMSDEFFAITFIFGLFIFAGCLFLLSKYRSKTSAVLIIVLASISLLWSLINIAFSNYEEGKSLFFTGLFLWVSVRVVEATFKINRRAA